MALLALALAAMVVGCVFLILELHFDYEWDRRAAQVDTPIPAAAAPVASLASTAAEPLARVPSPWV